MTYSRAMQTELTVGDQQSPELSVRHLCYLERSLPDQRELPQLASVNAVDTRWLPALVQGLRHPCHLLVAEQRTSHRSFDGTTVVGVLPLFLVRSRLFGAYLVSAPYLSTGGISATTAEAETRLLTAATELADKLDVKHLELRHEQPSEHVRLNASLSSKVHMRLALPPDEATLWSSFKPKVRNQVRNGEKRDFTVTFGGAELLDDFYTVFSRNMRDLGTPVFSRRLFASILNSFGEDAELCVVRAGREVAAAALLVHERMRTVVPSASSLRKFNSTNANMLMYWHLLKRAMERTQSEFDFGRSTIDGPTFRFKKQWGAEPQQALWQYYVRRGDVGDLRPDNQRYQLAIQMWKKLPLWLANQIGPPIVRGIP